MSLQVDYESEEQETDEDKEDQGELEEENTEQDHLQEVRSETAEAAGVRGRRDGRKEEESSHQMRINAVLQASPAIQRYSFDEEHQLWCEVRLLSLCYSTPERDYKSLWLQNSDIEQRCGTAAEGFQFHQNAAAG